MDLASWCRGVARGHRLVAAGSCRTRRQLKSYVPHLETLEGRCLLSVQAVSLADPHLRGPTGGAGSVGFAVSADGRYVAFDSSAENLVPGDHNNGMDVFVRDALLGRTTLVSVNRFGTGSGDGASYNPVMSPDGRYVAFASDADNLVANDTNGASDVFLRDLSTGTTILLSANYAHTGSSNGSSSGPIFSADGSTVVFTSFASDLVPGDNNFNSDVFAYHISSGALQLVSMNRSGTGSGNGFSNSPTVSADGRFVGFTSGATDLVATPTSGPNVYVRDLLAQSTTLVSINAAGNAGGNAFSTDPAISANGQVVAFLSDATDLISGPYTRNENVFARDLRTGTTTLVSNSLDGLGKADGPCQDIFISAGGNRVGFDSYADNLVANDHNAAVDVFVRDLPSATTFLVSTNVSGVSGNGYLSQISDLSGDGNLVAFISIDSDLVPNDTNGTFDAFVRDLHAGTTVAVDLAGSDSPAPFGSTAPFFSRDQGKVVFSANGSGLWPNDLNNSENVFERNLSSGSLTLVSPRDPDLPCLTAGGFSTSAGYEHSVVSAGGRYVVFSSYALNLVPGASNGNLGDVYVRDLVQGTTTLVSANRTGTGGGNAASQAQAISANGRYVVFTSYATDLVGIPTSGNGDVYVRDLKTATTTLVSINQAGTAGGDFSSGQASISANGNLVAFQSYADNLVANDTNGSADVFVRNLRTGTTTLVSVNQAGSASGDGFSADPVISADGSVVAFDSFATDLVANDNNFTGDVFARNLQAGVTTLVSVNSSSDGSGNNFSFGPVISANGRAIAFTSYATDLVNTPVSGFADVYLRDLSANTTTLVSVNQAGTSGGNSFSDGPTISADGSRVAFESFATDLTTIPTANFSQNVFVRDLKAATTALVSINTTGTAAGNSSSFLPTISTDGTAIAFLSDSSDLVANDTNGATDVFLRNLNDGTTALCSANAAGTGSGNGSSGNFLQPSLSSDGHTVIFDSYASDLVGGDYNDASDVFAFVRGTDDSSRENGSLFRPLRAPSREVASVLLPSLNDVVIQSWAASLLVRPMDGQGLNSELCAGMPLGSTGGDPWQPVKAGLICGDALRWQFRQSWRHQAWSNRMSEKPLLDIFDQLFMDDSVDVLASPGRLVAVRF
jgi:Tol biopolymer transport system component